MQLECGSRTLDLSSPVVMGVLNVTPDSFSDGGKFNRIDAALNRAEQMLSGGAAIIDVGGESTRPGAQAVSEQEELDRVIPVVEKLSAYIDAVISVDTSTPAVMRESIRFGAGLINDVRAFTREKALEAISGKNIALCVMHMQGSPATMQMKPSYDSVVEEVMDFLQSRVEALASCGYKKEQIVLDPGFGFGKSLEHNLELLKHIDKFGSSGSPLLAGISRKSMLGLITGRQVDDRVSASVAAGLIAAGKGANILRVHDVKETIDALKVLQAVEGVR